MVDALVSKLLEFKFILEYSFRANISNMLVRETDFNLLIKKIALNTFDFCKVFLHENSPNFFGRANRVADSPKNGFSLFASYNFEKRWFRILMDDAIVTFYVLLRDIIVSQSGVDASAALQCSNDIADAENLTGIEYLIEKGIVVLDSEYKYKVNRNSRSKETRIYLNRHNSSYKEQLRKIDNKLNENYKHENFVFIDAKKRLDERGDLIFLGNLEYAGALRAVSRKLNVLDKFFDQEKNEENYNVKNESNGNGKNESKDNSKSKKRRKNNLEFSALDYSKYKEMCQIIAHVLNGSKKLKAADRIYAKYKLEKELHLFLSDCLYQNINVAMAGKNSGMLGKRDFDMLTCCVKLPNLFSRNLIVDSAFIALHNIQVSPSCARHEFFSDILSELRGNLVTYDPYPDNEYLSDFDKWIILYQRMINYLSDFLFPLYESVFMCLIFESFMGEKGAKLEHRNAMRLIFEQLGDYLNTKDIYDPLGRCSEHDVFEEISMTRQYFQTEVKDDNMLRYAKWCSSSMIKTPVVKAPLTMTDFESLLPNNKAIWNHNILQIAKIL